MNNLFTLFRAGVSAGLLTTALAVGAWGQTQQFTTAGGHSFTVPAGVLSLRAECVGGGGAGGRVTPSNVFDDDAGGGGGGGAYASGLAPVTGGTAYTVTVGAGGINNGNSTHGGNSYFADGLFILAEGGRTRTGNDDVNGAEGGKAANSVGTVKYNGGNGGNGNEGDADGGGGGGAAGSDGNGNSGNGINGGGPRSTYGGYGGNGGDEGATGVAGGTYGGGGGGSSAQGSNDRDGGPGASGIVVLTWCEVTAVAPSSVCASANATVVVTGTHFIGVDSVFINGVSVPFVVDNNTQITVTVPAGTGSGNLVVSTANGRSQAPTALTVTSYSVSVTGTGAQLTAIYNGGAGAGYQWINCLTGNSTIPGAVTATYTAPQNGLYAVQVTENGCSVTSPCFTVNNVSHAGIGEADAAELSLFPNPATGWCTVANGEQPMQRLRVVDLTGKTLLEYFPNATSVQLDVSGLNAGIYMVEVQGNDTQKVLRLQVY